MIVFFRVVNLLGGLALFLYGMRIMGDGLKSNSGGAMKAVLARITNKPIEEALSKLDMRLIENPGLALNESELVIDTLGDRRETGEHFSEDAQRELKVALLARYDDSIRGEEHNCIYNLHHSYTPQFPEISRRTRKNISACYRTATVRDQLGRSLQSGGLL